MHLLVLLKHLLDVALANPTSQLAMLFCPLTQLLSLGGVVCGGDVRGRFLREDVLDGKDLIEELELLLCGLAIGFIDNLTLELLYRQRQLRELIRCGLKWMAIEKFK